MNAWRIICRLIGFGLWLGVAEALATNPASTLSLPWETPAISKGDTNMLFRLGMSYFKGEGGHKDVTAALKAFTKAAELGNAEAKYALAYAYYYGVVPAVVAPIVVARITRREVHRRSVRQRSGSIDHDWWRAVDRRTGHHGRTVDHGRTGRRDHDGRMETHGQTERDVHRHARPGGNGDSGGQCDCDYDEEVFSSHTPDETGQPRKASRTQHRLNKAGIDKPA